MAEEEGGEGEAGAGSFGGGVGAGEGGGGGGEVADGDGDGDGAHVLCGLGRKDGEMNGLEGLKRIFESKIFNPAMHVMTRYDPPSFSSPFPAIRILDPA